MAIEQLLAVSSLSAPAPQALGSLGGQTGGAPGGPPCRDLLLLGRPGTRRRSLSHRAAWFARSRKALDEVVSQVWVAMRLTEASNGEAVAIRNGDAIE